VPSCCRRSKVTKVAMNPEEEVSANERAEPLLSGVIVVPWGVLGLVPADEGGTKKKKVNWQRRAEAPDEFTCIVDVMEFARFLLGPGSATADTAAGQVYQWLDLQGGAGFPQEVRERVTKETDAKRHVYSQKSVIHAVAPDLSSEDLKGGQLEKVVEALAAMYVSIFAEFIDAPDAVVLRMPPVSGDVIGEYSAMIPALTQEAMVAGYLLLEAEKRSEWEARRPTIEFCTVTEQEYDAFIDFLPGEIVQAAELADSEAAALPPIDDSAEAPEKPTPGEPGGGGAADATVDVDGGGAANTDGGGGRSKLAAKQRRAAVERRVAAREVAAPQREAALQRQEMQHQITNAEEADATALPASSEPQVESLEQASMPRDPRGQVSPEEEEAAVPASSQPVEPSDNENSKFYTLNITLIGAKSLRDEDWHGKSDPYAIVTVDNHERRHRTKQVKDTQDPVWNESFTIYNIQDSDTLRIALFDDDGTLSDPDPLGRCEEKCSRFIPDGFEGNIKVKENETKAEATVQVQITAVKQSEEIQAPE